jgi:predicted nucleotidyltransferase
MRTQRQEAIVEAGVRWAERDRRVRALLLKGSLARGDADERSDVDFVVVAQAGRLQELWAARRMIAEGLGGWLGGFDEVAWQAPHTFIGFCDGPVKVDFFFQEAEPAADPWLRDGFRALLDADGTPTGCDGRWLPNRHRQTSRSSTSTPGTGSGRCSSSCADPDMNGSSTSSRSSS